jgi:hypothetical protein
MAAQKQSKREGRKRHTSESEVLMPEWAKWIDRRLLKFFRLVKVAIPLFVCGTLIGIGIGKHYSPHYDDPIEIASYVAAQAKAPEPHMPEPHLGEPRIDEFKEEYTERGQLSAFLMPNVELTFDCDITRYSYIPGKPLPDPKGLPIPATAHRRHLDFDGALGVLFGSVEGFALSTRYPKFAKAVEQAKPEENIEYILTGGLALVSGVALGVELGYDDAPDCAAQPFVQSLKNPATWETIYQEYMKNHSLYFVYDNYGIPRLDQSRGLGKTMVSKKRSDVVTMIDKKTDIETFLDDVSVYHNWLTQAVHESTDYIPNFWIAEDQLAKTHPDQSSEWEDEVSNWARPRGPIAARILVDKRFKGDVEVVLRKWDFSRRDMMTLDWVSPPEVRSPLSMHYSLEQLMWDKTRYYTPVAKLKLLNMNF